MTEEDEEFSRNIIICGFCDNIIESDKVKDHSHLIAKYRRTAHNSCKINVTRKQSNFRAIVFRTFSNYGC